MNLIDSAADLFTRVRRRLGGVTPNYRQLLFDELQVCIEGRSVKRVLEIGPRDCEDTQRLLNLSPSQLVLVDLPDKQERVSQLVSDLKAPNVTLMIGNIMYDSTFESIEPFDLVWCTGVLYHNPEQLRMVRRLFDLTKPGGLLVLESATARRRQTRDQSCVEIWHRLDKVEHRRHHVSQNVTHLPSRLAIQAWLEMVGYVDVQASSCHRRVLRALQRTRAAFIARRPIDDPEKSTYYSIVGLDYQIGKSR